MKFNWFEIRRQIFHGLLGVVMVLGVIFDIFSVKRLLLIFIVGAVVSILSTKFNVPIISWFLKCFERKDVIVPGQGAMFFVLGSILVLAIFPRGIALASIIILALGDSFATLVGMHFGRVKSATRKSLEGFVAGAFAAFIGAFFFVDFFSALAGSLAAMFFELLEFKIGKKVIDDNVMVPLVAALVMWIVAFL